MKGIFVGFSTNGLATTMPVARTAAWDRANIGRKSRFQGPDEILRTTRVPNKEANAVRLRNMLPEYRKAWDPNLIQGGSRKRLSGNR